MDAHTATDEAQASGSPGQLRTERTPGGELTPLESPLQA